MLGPTRQNFASSQLYGLWCSVLHSRASSPLQSTPCGHRAHHQYPVMSQELLFFFRGSSGPPPHHNHNHTTSQPHHIHTTSTPHPHHIHTTSTPHPHHIHTTSQPQHLPGSSVTDSMYREHTDLHSPSHAGCN